VEKLINVLKPRTVSVERPGLEYRIREERSLVNRWDAVNRLMEMGPAARPAVPILTRLIEDRFEPMQLKINMIAVLSNIGPPAASALAALERLSATGDAQIKVAAVAAQWEIKTKSEMNQAIETNHESEIEALLPSLDSKGLLGLPVLCRILDSPRLSESLRDKAAIQLERIRYHNDLLLFSYTEKDSYPSGVFRTESQIAEIQRAIPKADRHLIERLSDDLSPKVVERLMMAIKRCRGRN
jgi:hypothetical protein